MHGEDMQGAGGGQLAAGGGAATWWPPMCPMRAEHAIRFSSVDVDIRACCRALDHRGNNPSALPAVAAPSLTKTGAARAIPAIRTPGAVEEALGGRAALVGRARQARANGSELPGKLGARLLCHLCPTAAN